MDKTAIQTSAPPASPPPPPPPPAPAATEPPTQPKPVRRRGPVMKVVYALASLKLTVVLMALAIVLVFIGTLAQVDDGIWTVVGNYFRSLYVWVPLRVLFAMFPQDVRANAPDFSFPFPGGWLIGGVMLLNMTLAYFVRYNHFTWKRVGVYILHGGLVVMMASEVITGLFAVEGQMAIPQGYTTNVVVQSRYYELAITSPDPDDKYLDEIVVPASMLKKAGAEVHDAALPFDIKVGQYMGNTSELRKPGMSEENRANAGFGREIMLDPQPEVSGTAKKQESDMPAAYLTFTTKDGKDLGTYLLSLRLNPQTVQVGDKTYKVALRFKQSYLPFSIKLNEFRFDRWEGTQKARNFSSNVDVIDPGSAPRNNVLIRMNDPLRHGGETFYQQSFDEKTEQTTVLQVVRNPGWLLPYLSCILVALGMMIHFGMHLNTFLERRRAV